MRNIKRFPVAPEEVEGILAQAYSEYSAKHGEEVGSLGPLIMYELPLFFAENPDIMQRFLETINP